MKKALLKSFAFVVMLTLVLGTAAAEMSVLVNSDTGNPYYSATSTVYVTWVDEPAEATAFILVQNDNTPPLAIDPNWDSLMNLSSATVAEGMTTLYAYAKDVDDNIIASANDWIVYSSNVPIITLGLHGDVTTGEPPNYGFTVEWETSTDAIGWLSYRAAGTTEWTTSVSSEQFSVYHDVSVADLTDKTTYEIVIHSNGITYGTLADPILTITTSIALPIDASLTWTGNGADANWTTGTNWSAGRPPANPLTTGILTFGADANGTTSTLDPKEWLGLGWGNELDTWTVNAFTRSGGGTHIVDLSGKTLIIAGNLQSISGLNFTNGRLQLGQSETQRVDLDIRSTTFSLGNLTGFTPYINRARIGWPKASGTLDLRGIDPGNGLLTLNTLQLAEGNEGTHHTGTLEFGSSTHTIHIKGTTQLASERSTANFGSSALGWKMPPGTSLIFGNPPVDGAGGSRGQLIMGTTGYHPNISSIVASEPQPGELGGTFAAYLSMMRIAWNQAMWSSQTITATLDLRKMDSCDIDTENVFIGVGRVNQYGTKNGVGRVYLPAGQLTAGSATIGDNSEGTGSVGLLELNGTNATITDSLTIGGHGSVVINLQGESAGLLVSSVLDIQHTSTRRGSIVINYNEPLSDLNIERYYGLRWTGDKVADILVLLDDKIIVNRDPAIVPGTLMPVYVPGVGEDPGMTYLVVTTEDILEAIAIDRDVEIFPYDGKDTVVVHIDDIDRSPEGQGITGRKITASGDLTSADDNIITIADLQPNDTIAVTLTLYKGEDAATATSTITAVLPETTTQDIAWTAGATTGWMQSYGISKPEWFWGENWSDGKAPAADASGTTVTVGTSGANIAARIAIDRSVGTLRRSGSGTHAIDLDANTLTVTTLLEVKSPLNFSNGTLQLGTPTVPANLTVWNTTFTVDQSVNLIRNLNRVEIMWFGGTGTLDLRGNVIQDGVFAMDRLYMGLGELSNVGNARLALDTSVQTIHVKSYAELASQASAVSLGDPDLQWKLPVGTNLMFGVRPEGEDPGTRAALVMARTGYHPNSANITASEGGTFDGYFSTMLIGGRSAQWQSFASNGQLDLKAMTSCNIDATTVRLGVGWYQDATNSGPAVGRVFLPAGTLHASSLTVGYHDSRSLGLLELNGTVATVGTTLKVDTYGTLRTNVGSTSSGLDLPHYQGSDPGNDPFAPVIDGVIEVNFLEMPADLSLRHYGLKWAGQRQRDLRGAAGRGAGLPDVRIRH